jgi:hypothetical protein
MSMLFTNQKKILLIISCFFLTSSIEANQAHCKNNEVVVRHFGAENTLCNTQEDLDFKPWYHHHQYYDEHEEHADPTGKLTDDTAWPAEREEYSDYLLRDLNEK